MKICLSIAGSDPVGGAGLQADIKTFCAYRVFGMAVPTAITIQNTGGLSGIEALPGSLVARQLEFLLSDVRPDAVKIGMTATGEVAEAVADGLKGLAAPVILDPILRAWDGCSMLDDRGLKILRERLIPIAALVTPNLDEASILSGVDARDIEGMKEAASAIRAMGAKAVLVKGGHLLGRAVDVLSGPDGVIEFDSARLTGRLAHGTGCALSAAIAAGLALGLDLAQAVRRAKSFVTLALQNGFEDIGRGRMQLNHLVRVPTGNSE